MAAKLVEGAALGAPFGLALKELYEAVTNAVRNALMFKDKLESLQSKLDTLNKWFEDIKDLNEVVGLKEDATKNFIKLMKKGKELVGECLEIGQWSPQRPIYGGKLSELEEDIQKSIDIFLPLFRTRIELENVTVMKKIQSTLNRIELGERNGKLSCEVPPPPRFTVGLDVHTEGLKRLLLVEEVPMLVISAPGGCGKTTLVKKLCQDQDIKGKYEENIFFVQVSETPNLEAIVSKLFGHKGRQLPKCQGEEDIVNQLGVLLKQIIGSILLILDDVWSELPRFQGEESFLDKFNFDIPKCQILVTSRNEFEGRFKKYPLPLLKDEDAEILLRDSAEWEDGRSPIPEEHMKKILKECGGYPLALNVIGRSLRRQPPEALQRLVENWSNGDSTIGPDRVVLDCLKRSLDVLDDVVKECFLDLGLFPKHQRIPVTALIDMWAELYKLDADGLDAIIKLREITSRNLASLVLMREGGKDVDKYYSEDFVLQHDLLRELAIDESSKGPIEERKRLILNISENDLPEQPQPINAQLLSITTDENFSSSWCNIEPSKVEVLVLNFQKHNYTLPYFVMKMQNLKALNITNYGFSFAELSNFQQLALAIILRRIRLEKVSIPSLCNTPLTSLEKISFYMCYIGQAFRKCTIKISDALPKLIEINIDYCNDLEELPDRLCELTCLKKLNITNCHKLSKLSQELGRLTNLEMLRLRSCTDLLGLPKSIKELCKLTILDISHCVNITKLPEHIGKLCNLEKLHMEGCLRFRSPLPPSTLDLERLKLVTCDEMRAKSWESIKEFQSNLQVKVATRGDVNLNWLRNHDF